MINNKKQILEIQLIISKADFKKQIQERIENGERLYKQISSQKDIEEYKEWNMSNGIFLKESFNDAQYYDRYRKDVGMAGANDDFGLKFVQTKIRMDGKIKKLKKIGEEVLGKDQ